MSDSGERDLDLDPVWQAAWRWVLLEHECAMQLDPAQQALKQAWLDEAPAHASSYKEACRIWLLAGLVPSSTALVDSVPVPVPGAAGAGKTQDAE